mmetsp:Transcript_7933/g.9434  ORF Transcript_7933/g.9434 Transcript_7933/m.9434 type:complete len:515 (-) Transcript_7933:203-1747(-)
MAPKSYNTIEKDTVLPSTIEEEKSATPWGAKKLAFVVVSAVTVGTLALSNASTTKVVQKGANLAAEAKTSTTAPVKVTYGDKTDAEIEGLFEQFIIDHNKPYSNDADTKAKRFAIFKENLADIDMYNLYNPMAVYGITNRADWTEVERSHMRGLKSASMAKQPGETRSSWQIMKDEYSSQDAIKLGEKGLDHVKEAGKAHSALYPQGSKGSASTTDVGAEIGGTLMSKGMFEWITEDDCAACTSFPHFSDYSSTNIPTNFDWRDLGAVGQVENQKYCGSCWSFSTAQDIAGVHFLETGELMRLSEQQLVACDPRDDGCDGGWPFRAMQYISDIGGMVTYEDYEYKGICAWDACGENADGEDDPTPTCDKEILNTNIEDKNVAAIEGYQLVAMGAEYEDLMKVALVKNGPLSVAFNAVGMDYYIHGVAGCDTGSEYTLAGCISDPTEYGTCDPTALDHAVLIVGYGTQDGVDYWMIKNSWAEEWGQDGYYRLLRGTNMCGVANFAVHSVIKKTDA